MKFQSREQRRETQTIYCKYKRGMGSEKSFVALGEC